MYCNWISGLLSIVFSLFGAMVPSLFAWRCFSLLARCLFGANREADFIMSNLNHLGESTFFFWCGEVLFGGGRHVSKDIVPLNIEGIWLATFLLDFVDSIKIS